MKPVCIKTMLWWGMFLLFLVSCHEEEEQLNSLSTYITLNETLWVLQYIEAGSGNPQTPPEEFEEMLYIYFNSDTTFSAGSPCNAGFGRYETDQEGGFHVNTLGSTLKGCADAEMEWENKFFNAIRNAERYLIDDDQLMLLGKNVMVFRQGTPPEKPDCFDFDNVQIDTNLCISEQCKITKIVNGEDTTVFLYEDNLLKTVSLKYGHPALTDRESQFIYDSAGRLSKVEAVNPVTRHRSLLKEIIWTSDGLMEEVITYDGSFVSVRQTFSYNAGGRMVSYVHRELGDEWVFRKDYAYDDRGNPVEEKTFNEQGELGVTRRYEYDYKTNPFKGLGYPAVYDIEPEVISYFSTNNVIKIIEQFPQQSEATIQRYVYTMNDICFPIEVKASFDLCSVTPVEYTYQCEP